ncbi:anti-sigma regulatory factor (Ser/Thr protein kinase) [Breznakibacter xylanolyticus]|uniref:Anti-sigma regulatory factor (Ser/Thr protein kinase) n=1 Tax=Breznakibacter xylanolyticus TaxID=990 RepID=A0A2W7NCT6_9BACT|nr:ATP-binding protein [Breznakibacter xylanolyticus]PZX18191.1 anti-sigma regulatory factor (Ser/Thr protein kinase) [Breznakibacter xylanolyticus]
MELTYEVEGGNFSKAGHASSSIKKVLKQLNVDPKVVKRVVVALYEAEVNVVAHAYNGIITARVEQGSVSIEVRDQGPGIPDIPLAMQAGYSTASAKVREMGFGAGMGLPNMKKNVDVLNISSQVGVGTRVELITYF